MHLKSIEFGQCWRPPVIGGNDLKIGDTINEQIGSNCQQKNFKFVGHIIDDKLR